MQAARVNGVTLHVEHRKGGPGSEARPTLVFANSLGTDHRIWNGVLDRLGGHWDALLYTKRGHGLSDAPPAPYRMDDHVGDLAALIDHVGIARAVPVGLSVGGQIVMGLAARAPERVAALVICDSGHRIGTRELWNERIAAVERAGVGAISDVILERWFSARFRAEDAAFPLYRAMLERTPTAGYAGTCAALRESDMEAIARALSLPVLLMVGSEDKSTPPELVRATHALIAGSRYELIEGVGHLPNVERPDTVADLIGGFLRENGLG